MKTALNGSSVGEEDNSFVEAQKIGPLSVGEKEQLSQCENVIDAGLKTFIAVGQALWTIKERRLYRETHLNFEKYCRERWDLSRIHAYRLIGAAEVVSSLLPIGNIPLPDHESVVRPLTGIDAKLVPTVWQKAVELSEDGKVTARDVKAALNVLNRESSPVSMDKSEREESASNIEYLSECFNKLIKHIKRGNKDKAISLLEIMKEEVKKL